MNLNSLIPSVSTEVCNPSKNVLINDVEIEGTLRFEGELIFDGKIKGEIISNGALTLGKAAVVDGEVKVKSVVIYGFVTGNVTIAEKCELKSSAQLTGDLKASRILIEEGATFVGRSEVSPHKSTKSSEPVRSHPIPAAPAPSFQEPIRKTPTSALN